MLSGLTLLLICQLIGEVLARVLHLPVPGPVLGLLLLLVILLRLDDAPASVRRAAESLLQHLALFYVPAGVGLIVHAARIAEDGRNIAIVLILSSAVTLAVTAWCFNYLLRRFNSEEQPPSQ